MNQTERLLNAAADHIAATLEQPSDMRAWEQLLIYCPSAIQLQARLDRAVTRGLEQVERIAALEAALREYEDDYCEGWCRDAPPQAMFDCGGCRARAALAPEQNK